MKERPIIMGAESVKAVLEGRKTQTRRVVKPQPKFIGAPNVPFKTDDANPKGIINCPYGNVGDRLWVRETWFHGDAWYDDNTSMSWKNTHRDGKCTWVDYKATNTEPDFDECWKSPMFMPRWASRITLEITDIRVERLQDITEDDAVAEGIEFRGRYWMGGIHPVKGTHKCRISAIEAYQDLWDQLNAKRGYPWESNPWVWAVTFKVVQ